MSAEIFSLQDFLTLTKSISYLLALGFILLFVVYWAFLIGKEDDNRKPLEPDDYDILQDLGPTYFIKDFVYKLFGRSQKDNRQ